MGDDDELQIYFSDDVVGVAVPIAGLFSVQRHNHTANYDRKLKFGMEVPNTCIK